MHKAQGSTLTGNVDIMFSHGVTYKDKVRQVIVNREAIHYTALSRATRIQNVRFIYSWNGKSPRDQRLDQLAKVTASNDVLEFDEQSQQAARPFWCSM